MIPEYDLVPEQSSGITVPKQLLGPAGGPVNKVRLPCRRSQAGRCELEHRETVNDIPLQWVKWPDLPSAMWRAIKKIV
jgi:hypothetical protein